MALPEHQQQFCVNLVRAIEKHECLYNYNLGDHSRRDIVEKAWVEVANEANEEVWKCKEKWRNIRTVFLRHLKEGPISSKRKKSYYLNDSLQFLVPFIKTSTSDISGNVPTPPSETQTTDIESDYLGNESDSNDDECQSTGIPMRNKKRKRKDISEVDKSLIQFCNYRKNLEDDAKKLFLISLLPDFNLMDHRQTRKFKLGVLALIDEILDSNRPSTSI